METRKCRTCHEVKPVEEFYLRWKKKSRELDCSKCSNKRTAACRRPVSEDLRYVYTGALKTCKKCAEEKEDYKFALRADKGGLRPSCRTCMSRHIAGSQAAEKALLKYTLKTKYSLTVADYEQKLIEQEDVCAICRGANKSGRRLHVDHCHETGKFRGLLCINCNAGLGQFGDSLALLEAAAEYMRKNG